MLANYLLKKKKKNETGKRKPSRIKTVQLNIDLKQKAKAHKTKTAELHSKGVFILKHRVT